MPKHSNTGQNSNTTHFGFRNVKYSEKSALVRNVFNNVAPNYDLMNDIMSFGIHRLWKTNLIERLNPHKDMRLLDIGGGTGDIAFKFIKRGGRNVVVVDINEEMLAIGQDRALNQGIVRQIEWINSDAENLPFKDSLFDTYITAFCLRNVARLDFALKEAYRLLRPGGRFLCLEFSHIILPNLSRLYDMYSFNVLPLMGQIIAKDKDSYQYLAESIRRFPQQDDFLNLIKESGFEKATYQNLSHGIVAIHSAWKI